MADALSRNLVSKDSLSNSSGQVLQVDSEPPIATKTADAKLQSQDSEIGQLQQKDEEFAPIFRYLEDGILPDDEHKAKKLALEKSRFDVIEVSYTMKTLIRLGVGKLQCLNASGLPS